MKCVPVFSAAVLALLFAPPRAPRANSAPPSPHTQSSSAQITQTQSPPAQKAPIHIDGDIMISKLVHAVPAVYPQIAVMAHVSGTVVLHAIITMDGKVQQLTFISGPVLLRDAAMNAVRQWRFAPTLLNGQPAEVETTIPVNFWLPEWQRTFKFNVNEAGSSRVILAENIDLGGSGKMQQWNDWIAAFENATSRAWLAASSSAASEKKGKVTVEFTLRSDGKIEGLVAVVHSSGDSAIDDATQLAMQKCAPFQPLPANPHYPNTIVRITFAYNHPHPLAPAAGATQ